jgi:diguanylate cyclase (GGDEF)-like protein
VHKGRTVSPEEIDVTAIAFLSEVDRLHYVVETQRLVNLATLSPDNVIAVVVGRTRTATGADGGSVELMDGHDLVTRATSGIVDAPKGARVRMEHSLSGHCMRQGVALICRDTETDGRVDRDACRAAGVRSMVVAPLTYRGRAVGVLKVHSGQPGQFDDADLDVVELMANGLASSFSSSCSSSLDARNVLYDQLTGLASRALLMDRLTQVVYEARRYGRSFGLFFIDLDGFAAMTESFGRETADGVLRAVASGLSATVRTGDTLARLGGDQFVIVCGNADRSVEERIRTRIDTVFDKVRGELQLEGFELTASIGVLWSTGDEASAENLLTAAMASMYRTKRQHSHLDR